jgi:hypothetical protein
VRKNKENVVEQWCFSGKNEEMLLTSVFQQWENEEKCCCRVVFQQRTNEENVVEDVSAAGKMRKCC